MAPKVFRQLSQTLKWHCIRWRIAGSFLGVFGSYLPKSMKRRTHISVATITNTVKPTLCHILLFFPNRQNKTKITHICMCSIAPSPCLISQFLQDLHELCLTSYQYTWFARLIQYISWRFKISYVKKKSIIIGSNVSAQNCMYLFRICNLLRLMYCVLL